MNIIRYTFDQRALERGLDVQTMDLPIDSIVISVTANNGSLEAWVLDRCESAGTTPRTFEILREQGVLEDHWVRCFIGTAIHQTSTTPQIQVAFHIFERTAVRE